jgi:lipopolysaccharide biosynthesis glycosyltransferase
MKLNIVYTISETIYYMARVSLDSLFASNKKNKINLYILYDEKLSQNNLDELKNLSNIYKNCAAVNTLAIDSQKYKKFGRISNLRREKTKLPTINHATYHPPAPFPTHHLPHLPPSLRTLLPLRWNRNNGRYHPNDLIP